MDVNKIVVIGAGTMGNGIAQVFATEGYEVTICDVNENALAKAKTTIQTNLGRMVSKGLITEEKVSAIVESIAYVIDLDTVASTADLVIEAASERLEIKQKIFKHLDTVTPEHCILATNTSSIPITLLAAATRRPAQVIGMHFMNPVPVMKLVEVIRGFDTSDEVCDTVLSLTESIQKTHVLVNDYPGFVANRILMPMINEAIITLHEGVAGVDEIDTVMRLGMAHPMGPLQLADFIGLDVCLSILKIMYDGFGNQKYAPCPLLVNMVTAGKLGRKSGEGFYKYTAGSKEVVVSSKFL